MAAGSRHQNVGDLFRGIAIFALEPHDQVKLLFLLHHLGGHVAADGGLDQAVDIRDVESVARDFRPIDFDGQAWLPELLDQGDVADSAHLLQDLLDRFAFLFEGAQIGTENLDREGALQSRFSLIHRILGGLSVVEVDAGK